MRLCLDEHYSPRIAVALRSLGHDVYAVREKRGSVALPTLHYGLISSAPPPLPRSTNTVGIFVERLAATLDGHRGEDGIANTIVWL